MKGDNIFFLVGSEDPWQFANMRELQHPKTTQSTMHTFYMNCESCGHCMDILPPYEGQPDAIT